MVPGTLRVSPARPATSTSGAGDLGGASVVRPTAALAGGKSWYWFVRGKKWYALLPGQVRPLLLMWSTWKVASHAPFISVSGAILVTGISR